MSPAGSAAHPAFMECKVSECGECGARDCPRDDALHYHHDGCPSCWSAAMNCDDNPARGRRHYENNGCAKCMPTKPGTSTVGPISSLVLPPAASSNAVVPVFDTKVGSVDSDTDMPAPLSLFA